MRHLLFAVLVCAVGAGSSAYAQVATDWDPHWVNDQPPGFMAQSGSIHAAIEFDHDNDIDTKPSLFVGGDFSDVDGDTNLRFLARWDAESAQWVSAGDFDGPVFSLISWDDPDDSSEFEVLVAGGGFTDIDGSMMMTRQRIAKRTWDDVLMLASWDQIGSGLDDDVLALEIYDDQLGGGPKLFAGGEFVFNGTGAVLLPRIAVFDSGDWAQVTRGVEIGFDSPSGMVAVRALEVFDDKLFIGGSFKRAVRHCPSCGGGPGTPRNMFNISAWDGIVYSQISSPGASKVGLDDTVHALAALDDGEGSGEQLFIGGEFLDTEDGDGITPRLVAWTGTDWANIGSGLDDEVLALHAHNDSGGVSNPPTLFIGGSFIKDGDAALTLNGVAEWGKPKPSDTSAVMQALGDLNSEGVVGAVQAFSSFDVDGGFGQEPVLVVGGTFSDAGGVMMTENIAGWTQVPSAPDPYPVMWYWQPPVAGTGALAHVPTSTARVKVFKSGNVGMSGEEAALEVCRLIQDWSLNEGEIAVLLQDWGHGDGSPTNIRRDGVSLFWHDDDATVPPPNWETACTQYCSGLPYPQVETRYWLTPWMTNGIVETRDWVAGPDGLDPATIPSDTGDMGFIPAYRYYQANYTLTGSSNPNHLISDPSRFHMDIEATVAGCCNYQWVCDFKHIFNDSKASDPNFDIPGFSGRTLIDLWEEFMVAQNLPESTSPEEYLDDNNDPPLQPCIHLDPDKMTWNIWYSEIAARAKEAAVEQSLYAPVREAWQGCKTSDYNQSMRYDGDAGDPPRIHRGSFGAGAWNTPAWIGFGDFQAPNTYHPGSTGHVDPSHIDSTIGETSLEATIRVFRERVSGATDSFGGGHENELAVWVAPPLVFGQQSFQFDMRESADMYAMLRAEGVQELFVWTGFPSTDPGALDVMTNLSDLISRVWDTDLQSIQTELGSQIPGTGLNQLGTADCEFAEFTAAQDTDLQYKVQLIAIFDTAFDMPVEALKVYFESKFTDATPLTVVQGAVDAKIQPMGPFDSIGPFDAPSRVPDPYGDGITVANECAWRSTMVFIDDPSDKYVHPTSGVVELRITWVDDDPFTLKLDYLGIAGTE